MFSRILFEPGFEPNSSTFEPSRQEEKDQEQPSPPMFNSDDRSGDPFELPVLDGNKEREEGIDAENAQPQFQSEVSENKLLNENPPGDDPFSEKDNEENENNEKEDGLDGVDDGQKVDNTGNQVNNNNIRSGRDTNIFIGKGTQDSLLPYLDDIQLSRPQGSLGSEGRKLLLGCISELEEKRVLIIDGYDEPTNELLAFEICSSEKLNVKRRKKVFVRNLSGNDAGFMQDLLLLGKDKDESDILIALSLAENAPSNSLLDYFLENLEKPGVEFDNRLKGFNERNLYFLLISSTPSAINKLSALENSERIGRFHIPCLQFMLLRYYQPNDAKTILELIRQLQEAKRWPTDDESAYNQLSRFLQKGVGYSYQQILREANATDEDYKQQKGLEVVESPEIVLDKGEPLLLALCFAGSYFPGLPVTEFRYLVNLLLEARLEPVEQPGYLPDFDQELWSKYPDQWMKKARLSGRYSGEVQTQVISFNIPGFEEACKNYLSIYYPCYLDEMWKHILINQNLLFVLNSSGPLYTMLISNAASQVSLLPDVYCQHLLNASFEFYANGYSQSGEAAMENPENIVTGAKQQTNDQDGEIKVMAQPSAPDWNQRDNAELGNPYLNPCKLLLDALLDFPSLDKYIEKFLDSLEFHGAPGLDLLFNLLCRSGLYQKPGIHKHFKTLMRRAGEKTKVRVFKAIAEMIQYDKPEKLFSHFSEILNPSLLNEGLGAKDLAYFKMIKLYYFQQVLKEVSHEKYGQWPTDFQFFQALENKSLDNAEVNGFFKDFFSLTITEEDKRVFPTKGNRATIGGLTSLGIAIRNIGRFRVRMVLKCLEIAGINCFKEPFQQQSPTARVFIDFLVQNLSSPDRITFRDNIRIEYNLLIQKIGETKVRSSERTYLLKQRELLQELLSFFNHKISTNASQHISTVFNC